MAPLNIDSISEDLLKSDNESNDEGENYILQCVIA